MTARRLRLHVTGDPHSAARLTRDAARARGLPQTALTVEDRLGFDPAERALFSQPDLARDADHLILVTEAWHLPRAWASFAMAGQPAPVACLPRPGSARAGLALRMIAREAAAIWFNAGPRGGLVWGLAGLGVARSTGGTAWLR
jgi:uncharacterized SAM-binding protein YcdF (DUF218 family)